MIADFTPVEKQTIEKILSLCKTKFSEPALNDVWKSKENLYSELRIQFAKYYLCYYPFEKNRN